MLAEATFQFDYLALLSRVVHTTCGATLLGGLVYLRFVLAPAAPRSDSEAVLFAGRRSAWAACVGVCTLLLLVSGSYNFWLVLTQYEKPVGPYHMLFGIKSLLAIGLFVLMALLAGKTGAAQRLRGNLAFWLNTSLALALAIFVLGAMLRSIPKTPKAAETVVSELKLEHTTTVTRG